MKLDYARRAYRLVALVAAMGYPGVAHAGVAYRLDWRVDPQLGCPSEIAFQAAVTRELDRDVFSVEAESTLRVEVATSDRGLVRISLVDPEDKVLAERSFTGGGANCSALLDGAVLALGVLLNEETPKPDVLGQGETPTTPSVGEAAASDTATLAAVPAPPSVPRSLAVAAEPRPPALRDSAALSPTGVRISALAVGYAGLLPQLAFGATFAGAYAWAGGLAVGLELGVISYSTSRRVIEATETELRLSLLRAAAFVEYPVYRARHWDWALGVVGHVGRLGVDVSGARSVGAAGYVWAAAGARTTLRAPLGRVSGVLAVDVLAPLTPREFGVVEGPVLARLAPAAGFISLGIDMDL